ncbi:MAG: tetratricopeptide repeat protein [Candidatus Riflebacteria bacterium]|nr:tetratricopeptide repeat protein [Candidatus Riflebacteria bacterium]
MAFCNKCKTVSSGVFCGKCGSSLESSPKPVINTALQTAEAQQKKEKTPAKTQTLPILEEALKKNPSDSQAYINLAEAQMATGRLNKAFSTFRAGRALAPDSPKLLKCGAKILTALERKEEAIEALEKALTLESPAIDPSSLLLLSTLLYDTGRKQRALFWLQKLTDSPAQTPEAIIKIAQIHLSLGNPSEAQKFLNVYREMAGPGLKMYKLMGETMLARRFFDGAVKNYSEALENWPGDWELHLGLGKAYYGTGNKEAALKEFEAGIAIEEDISLLTEMGKLQYESGLEEAGKDTFAKILQKSDKTGEHLLAIAEFYLKHKKLSAATAYLKEAEILSPYHLKIRKLLGKTLTAQGKHVEAAKVFKDLLKIEPESRDTYKDLIESAGESANYQLQADTYSKYFELLNPTAEDWCDYGETLIKLEQFDKAQEAFEQAAETDPACIRAYKAPDLIAEQKTKSQARKIAQKGDEALENKLFLTAAAKYQEALDVLPGDETILRKLAEVYITTAEIGEAGNILTKLRAKKPQDPWLCKNLAAVYEAENKTRMAAELLSSYTADFPEDYEAQKNLLRLRRTQLVSSLIEPDMLTTVIKEIESFAKALPSDTADADLLKGYAAYLFSIRTRFQDKGISDARKYFGYALQNDKDNKEAKKGLILCERATGNVEKAAAIAYELAKNSPNEENIYRLAKLCENFGNFKEGRRIYANLRNKYPENGLYRKKFIELSAKEKTAGLPELKEMLTQNLKELQRPEVSIWTVYETAIAQELLASEDANPENSIKRALLTWQRAALHKDTNIWVTAAMSECQFRHVQDAQRESVIKRAVKAALSASADAPDSALAKLVLAQALLAFGDPMNDEKALKYLKQAWFLDRNLTDAGILLAKTARARGQTLIVDSVMYNVLLLEPELSNRLAN